jgi:hypothetical protein
MALRKETIVVLLLGSLVLSVSTAPEENPENGQAPSLVNVFPHGSIPRNPNEFQPSSDPSHQAATNNAPRRGPSGIVVNQRDIHQLPVEDQKSAGQVYRYEIPLEEEPTGEQEVELQGESPYTRNQEYDDNNARENTHDKGSYYAEKSYKKEKKAKTDFSSIQDFQYENKHSKKQKYNKKARSDNATVIEGAGTGYHPDVAVLVHPDGQVFEEQHEKIHQHHHGIVEPQHVVVEHQEGIQGRILGFF